MIEVENLTKYYGAFPALRDVTFSVEPGEILGFLGPNGAGKTTTMRIITGYIPPTLGTVRVAGFDVSQKSLEARKHLGYLPETVPLYAELTPWEYLDFKGRISGMHNTRERRSRIIEIMDRINLGDVSEKLIGSLSRGYRQRVGLAQAMLHNPDVLILDEPTVGLDPVQITDARNLIKELGRDHTIILSTHLLPEVSMVCNRVIIINRGRLVALDTPFHLTEGAGEGTVQLAVAGEPQKVLADLRSVPGVRKVMQMPAAEVPGSNGHGETAAATEPSDVNSYEVEASPGEDVRAQLAETVVSAGYSLLELKTVKPSLEEIFIRVISQAQENELEEESEAELLEEEMSNGEDMLDEEEEEIAAAPARTRVVTKRRVRK
ncbi:MAG TPA: ATP-binding cassette domain-containing protein [Chloroflexia bacterium]|nr:ATP-binding cassette domain-containing protein [Chloroflexia bacterium]